MRCVWFGRRGDKIAIMERSQLIFLVSFAFLSLSSVTCGVEETTTKEDDIHYISDDSSFNEKAPEGGAGVTETIKRAFDSNSPDENKALSLLQNYKNGEDSAAAGGKYLSDDDHVSATAAEKPKNIQRVPPKGIMDRLFQRSESYVPFSNVSNSDVQWLTRIFNVLHWDAENIPAAEMIGARCSSLMQLYLKSLHGGVLWANKMSDSSGRYSSQFFFGNDFWLGSRTECRELQNKLYNDIVPPFPVHFFVSKFLLRMEIPPRKYLRMLSIGLCLPKECTVDDIKAMLLEDSKLVKTDTPARNLTVLTVRAVPGTYSLYADKKLHLLLTILSVVIILTIIGTCYEISLERKRNRFYRKHHQTSVISNNNDGDMKIIAPVEKLAHLELKIENGYPTKNTSAAVVSPPCNFDGESAMSQFVLSFSAISNSRKILHVGPTPEESLTCVHGLRFLSLAWVIMVHTYLQVFTIAENKSLRTLAERNFMFQTVSNATFSVDTFFFISGLLVTYLYFKSAKKEIADKGRRQQGSGVVMNVAKFFKLVGYRFLRLTPAYMFVLLIAEISMRWIHNNSVFEPISQNHISCDKYWWRNILYINSLFPMNDMCMLWSWYVSNDTQFYVLGIIILLFSIRYFRFSAVLLVFFLLLSWAVTISISLIYEFRAKIEDPFLLFDELYDKPWTRLGPYLVGMFTGWLIFKTKAKLKVSKVTVLVAWFLSIFTLISLVYGLHVFPLGRIGSAIYVSVGHTAWAVALAWMVIACCSGHGGFIDSFLSFRLLHPLSRLTYCAYLVHPIIMTTTNFQMNAPLHLQDSIVMILYFGNALASFASSFCISLLFEAPTVRLLKLIFSPQPRKTNKNQTTL